MLVSSISVNSKKLLAICLLLATFLSAHDLYGQKAKKRIDIKHADWGEYNKLIVSNAQRLIGNVQFQHQNALMWCDSAYFYDDRNMVDAFGNVHIVKDDTLHLYADFINYDGDIRFAKARNNVKLINKETTLITDSLDFDGKSNIAYYDYYGTITDSTNVLTSVIGQYYTKNDMAYFKKEVIATTDKYTLFSDTLIYNTTTKEVYMVGPTTIEDEESKLYTENGFYNSETGEIRLLKKPNIENDKQRVKADSIFYNKVDGDGLAVGNVEIEDFENRIIIKGNRIVYNEEKKTSMVTDSAMFIQYNEKDSLFMHADTLRTVPDTSAVDAKLVFAYYKVKFFREDLQGKCDSLVYWSKDSTVQLFHEPVIWTNNNQLTANYIEMTKNAGKPDLVNMKDDAFIISMEPDSIRFNQIRGKNMTSYILNNELYRIDVDGNGESLYYARDAEGVIGLNKAESSRIVINLKDSKVKRISFISNPEGTLTPMLQLIDEDTKLQGFEWLNDIRPKDILDIFRKSETQIIDQVKEEIKKQD